MRNMCRVAADLDPDPDPETTACPSQRRYLREAEQAEGKERLNLLAEHVLDVWLWTLAQVQL
jgi:hypothetical protein